MFILAYNRSNKKHTRLFNKENIEDSIHHIAQFIRSKTLEATKELSIDIADEIFRSSLQVFNKYQNIGWDRNEINN